MTQSNTGDPCIQTTGASRPRTFYQLLENIQVTHVSRVLSCVSLETSGLDQWCTVTQYIYFLGFSILLDYFQCPVLLLLHIGSKYCTFTPLHLFEDFSYIPDIDYHIIKHRGHRHAGFWWTFLSKKKKKKRCHRHTK